MNQYANIKQNKINTNTYLYPSQIHSYSIYTYGSVPYSSYNHMSKYIQPSLQPSLQPSENIFMPSISPTRVEPNLSTNETQIIIITVITTSSVLFFIFFLWYRRYYVRYTKLRQEFIEEFGIDISRCKDF